MSENKRRWFQIHLSTAIVLMFLASSLLYINTRIVEKYYMGDENGEIVETTPVGVPMQHRGFPFQYWYGGGFGTYLDMRFLIADFGCAVGVLLLTAIVSEWVVRREAPKP